MTSASILSSSSPSSLPQEGLATLAQMRKGADAQKIVSFVKSGYEMAKAARSQKQLQWYMNLSFFFGKQWAEVVKGNMPDGFRDKLQVPKAPYYRKRKTINRTRAFVRTEHSKFLSAIPNVMSVPGTAEDQDVRAAYAAEQAWNSISNAQKLRTHFSRAAWWMVTTGNGFMKVQWDQNTLDRVSGQMGAIKFGAVTPFHLFVPDIREQDIEDQPYLINAYIKPLGWCMNYFGAKLDGKELKPSVASQNTLLDEGYLNLSQSAGQRPDSCIVYEAWIKPGATPLLPQGGVVIMVDDILIDLHEGLPYKHGQYPYVKFEHIPTSTFYADSPLVDVIGLNREYNESRTDISDYARKMGRPQLLAQRNSIVTSKVTNEAGLIIEYRQGTPPPQPLALTPLPQYVVDQQDRILMDIEDITGQHEVTRGQAPAGITAGTAINYLGEKDNQFLTPEYQSMEDGYGKLAEQTLELFVQYVDVPRKIKTIGADMAFDTMALSGSDIEGGTDVRVEPGSSVGQSKAASDARVMDMFAMGLITQDTALRLIEIGGSQKVVDLLHVAEKKAQRENIKMKALTPDQIMMHQMEAMQQSLMAPPAPMGAPPMGAPMDPEGPTDPGGMGDTEGPGDAQLGNQGAMPGGMGLPQSPTLPGDPNAPMGPPPVSPVVPVDDFDVHEIHVETHNKFRMSQEYEMLDPAVKDQFAQHVKSHEDMLIQKQMMDFLQMSDGSAPTDPNGGSLPGIPPGAGPGDPGVSGDSPMGPGATMAGNGQVPDMTSGGPNG